MIDRVPSSSTLNASPPEVLAEPDSSFAVIVKVVGIPAVMVATGVPIDFVASVVSEMESACKGINNSDVCVGSGELLTCTCRLKEYGQQGKNDS